MINQFLIIGTEVYEVPETVHKWALWANDVIKQTIRVRKLQALYLNRDNIPLSAVIAEEKKLEELFDLTINDQKLK